MIVEIRKAGFVNKGAELMLNAVVQKVKERYPDVTLVMAPTHSQAGQPYHKLAPMGFFPKAWLWRAGIQLGDVAGILPRKLREMYGVVLDRQVDVVLDAAGFAYSDQWGLESCKELARSSERWRRRGTKVILLPQALGPFETKNMASCVRQWVRNSDLIFAREEDSYRYLTETVGEQPKIKLFPDFTNLIDGILPEGYSSDNKRIALVPNYQMIDKTSPQESAAYLPFMIACAKYLVDKQAQPFVLVHEGEKDLKLAKKISEAVGGIPVVREADPLHIKGILGTCDATIGSRFHGLVSALSQGVPSLATGWSHKYIRLFEEYGFTQGLVSVLDSDKILHQKIDLLLELDSVNSIRNELYMRSKKLKGMSEEMWELVFSQMDEKACT
jgi:polysaccharide pyruvyl transferase WcaK-like protein